ncbi:Conserved_hypothetical protein [Hexamita inflata]|uniref:Uncharacterized protein n=1 Tax=Hexamita inflata TaxID=28002 RepID=A0AA86P5A5_9EUKA|nr:Conserved hypothetical protein [Hexamita inflata]
MSFIRIPKIMIIMDDMSGTSLFTNSVENEFYKFIVQRRHLHVFTFMISAHSITNLYYQFRVNQTAIVLFNGLKMDQMKEYFNTIQEVQSNNFGEKELTEIYKQITGYYEQDFDKKATYRYNFLYTVIQPMPSIYKGFKERIKKYFLKSHLSANFLSPDKQSIPEFIIDPAPGTIPIKPQPIVLQEHYWLFSLALCLINFLQKLV